MNASPAKATSPLDNDEMLLVLQQSLSKKRVLIVDRHPPARDSLRLMLGALGVTAVHGAGNSAEVIRQVKGNRFDIILSDFVLDDGRDGQQLLEELRHAHLIPLATVYMIITSERSYTNVVALAAAVLILDGIGFGDSTGWDQVADNFWALLFVALILGIVNSFVSPIIKFLSIPFIIITLGLFLLVINALMLLFTEWLVNLFDIDFYVDGFWNAVGGAIVITVVTWIVGLLFGDAQE